MAPQAYLPVFPFPSGQEGDVREATFDAWQPKATIRWKPTDALAVYGVYAQGFRSGGFNLSGVAAGVAALRSAGVPGMPEGVQRFVGPGRHARRGVRLQVESAAAARRRFNASGFYTRIDDAFTFFFVAPFNAQIIRNIDEARVGRLRSRRRPGCRVSGLQLDLAVGLLDTEILQERVAGDRRRRHRRQAAAVQPATRPSTPASAIRDRCVEGWQGFGAIRLRAPRAHGVRSRELRAARSDQPAEPARRRDRRAAAGSSRSGSRNLTNKDYLAESINPNGISWLGKPRQWGLEVTKRF